MGRPGPDAEQRVLQGLSERRTPTTKFCHVCHKRSDLTEHLIFPLIVVNRSCDVPVEGGNSASFIVYGQIRIQT